MNELGFFCFGLLVGALVAGFWFESALKGAQREIKSAMALCAEIQQKMQRGEL